MRQTPCSEHDEAKIAETLSIHSPEEMMAFGATLAQRVVPPKVIALCGDLGAGKTTLAKGMISALTATPPSEVTSPTFQYVQFYKKGDLVIAHFDVWRLQCVDEFIELGLEEYLLHSLAIVEWPDRIQGVLPSDTFWVHVSIVPEGGRCVSLHPRI
jgi:tRNA threonylcarbamoyladenosine biosynthesis protein TsaE